MDANDAKLDRSPRFNVSLKPEDMKDFEQLCNSEKRSKSDMARILILEAIARAKSKGTI